MSDDLIRSNLVVQKDKLSPTLKCSICLDLVMKPVECQNCSKLFCEECINNWLKNTKQCPNKHSFIKKEKLDDWVNDILKKLFIKCPYKGCNSPYAYTTWRNHTIICVCKSKGYANLNGTTTTPTGDEIFEWKDIQFFVKDINNRTHIFFCH